MNHCCYYQAVIDKKMTWFFAGALRSFEHVAFDRTLDPKTGTFEFFVAPDLEADFLGLMRHLEQQKVIANLRKMPNRLAASGAQV